LAYNILVNVSLTPDIERRIRERVKAGMYGNASEVVREALRLYFARDDRKAWFEGEIQKGLDDVAAGRVYDGSEEFWRELKNDARNRMSKRQAKAS